MGVYGPYAAVSANAHGITFTDSGLTDGHTYYYKLRLHDSVGNASEFTTAVHALVDITAPESPVLTASKATINGSTTHLSWTSDVSPSQFILTESVNGTTPTIVSSNIRSSQRSLTLANRVDSTYIYSIYAIDESLNTSNAGIAAPIVIDTTAPTKPVRFSATADDSSVILSWSNSVVTTKTLLGLEDGTYYFSLFAKYIFTNTSQKAMTTVTVDAKPTLAKLIDHLEVKKESLLLRAILQRQF